MAIAGFALFVLGLVFLIVAPINKRKNSRCSAQTQGTLKDIWKRRRSNGPDTKTYVYTYSVDGVEYRISSSTRGKGASQVGDSCTIWYNPKKPKEAQPFHYESAKAYRIVFVIGIVLVLVGIVLTVVGL